MRFYPKHFLTMQELSGEEIIELLNIADQLKYEKKNGIPHPRLAGKTLGMIFQKSSTRTRISFEVGIYQLGGTALFLSPNDLQIGRGEPLSDTGRCLARYLDGIMIRTYAHEDVERLTEYGIPVVNGLTDYAHPCQVLADLMTIREYKSTLKGLKLTFIGDGNNMANSLITGCLNVGMSISIACPKGYEPHEKVLAYAAGFGDKFTLTDNIQKACEGSDVLVTDVWASMGHEAEAAKRLEAFKGYQINDKTLFYANAEAMVLHCLPAHRGEEITEEVLERHAGMIFDEAENRLHAQKAILIKLMEK
ncbi:MAG: ornithine carbamoyltransferase [Defluviitaleaceae bacterium]|nr:ornithine carbamoyltransferase [Defluviitaleaceae bacterium]MCL2836163.1 ornithine carbamoyltransferase [Defluviitaleaceae bacterium]